MKRKIWTAAAAVLAAAALGVFFYGRYQEQTYIEIGGVEYRRDATALDLSGQAVEDPLGYAALEKLELLDLTGTGVTIEQYDALRQALPGCEIRWEVPFQGGRVAYDVTSLTVATLTAEDAAVLAYFPALERIDAGDCRDYGVLTDLMEAHPEWEIFYRVPLGGESYAWDTEELTLTDASAEELDTYLPWLPRLERVRLEGTLPAADALAALWEEYPQVNFYWQVQVCGVTADVDTVELDLSGIPMASVAEVEEGAAYLPSLEKVLMIDCGISNEEMEALNQRHEDVLFVWTVNVGGIILRTDETVFAPVQHGRKVYEGQLDNLRYCTELVVIDLGHMNLWTCNFLETMTKLEYLVLADTNIRDISALANLKNLKFLELFLTRVNDYSPLVECTALEDLNLCYTTGGYTPILEMTWLKRLWWCGSYMTRDQLQELRETLKDTQIVLPKLGSTDDGWRKGQNYYDMRDLMGMAYLD